MTAKSLHRWHELKLQRIQQTGATAIGEDEQPLVGARRGGPFFLPGFRVAEQGFEQPSVI